MNFDDTPQEAALRKEAHAFLAEHAPRFAGFGGGDMGDRSLLKRAKAWQACKREHGWACMTWPEEYGGRGAAPIESTIFRQEEAKFDTPPDLFTIGTGFMAPAIMLHGSEEQKQRYLEPIARGDELWCQLFSEPDAGSDVAGLRTSARRDGDDWVLSGQKNWTTGAHISDWAVAVTRSDPSEAKHAGLTCFIVDMKAPGVEVRPIRQIDGGTDFNEVFLTDIRVPDSQRLGAVGNGWAVALTILMNERYTIGGGGGARPEDLLDTARKGGVVGDADVRQRIAEFYVRATGLRYNGYRIQTALSRGQTPGPEASIGKLVGARLQQEMASFALDLHGEFGVGTQADEWQRRFLAAPGNRIAGGTDEIMRNIIAERVLRLPPEPRLDKGKPYKEIPTGNAA